jgi:homoserine dehydrogenase
MESMLQHGRAPAGAVPVVITTHETDEAAMNRALARINALKALFEPARMIRVEPL